MREERYASTKPALSGNAKSKVLITAFSLFLLVGLALATIIVYFAVSPSSYGYGYGGIELIYNLLGYEFMIMLFILIYWLFVVKDRRLTLQNGAPTWSVNKVLAIVLLAFFLLDLATALINYDYGAIYQSSVANNSSCGYISPLTGFNIFGIFSYGVFNAGANLGSSGYYGASLCTVAPQLTGLSALESALELLLLVDLVFGLFYWYFEVKKEEKKKGGGSNTILIVIGIIIIILILLLLLFR